MCTNIETQQFNNTKQCFSSADGLQRGATAHLNFHRHVDVVVIVLDGFVIVIRGTQPAARYP